LGDVRPAKRDETKNPGHENGHPDEGGRFLLPDSWCVELKGAMHHEERHIGRPDPPGQSEPPPLE
jgi:hypothetical protein